ncbi:hypothetical protein WJX82_004173 [Trebouxia sp. C0006]
MPSATSTCNSGYDSDEDRHAAYLFSLQARRACQSHAQQQRKLLQRYRQQQETQRLLNDDVANPFSLCAAEAHSQSLRPDSNYHTSDTLCEDSPAHHAQNCAAAWAQHEERWRRIEDGTEDIQSLQAIPWPLFNAGIIAALAQRDTMMDRQLSSGKCPDNISSTSWRKAYRKALLRWHPDKMSARLVSVQNMAHRESAMQRVNQILDSIHNEWAQHMQQS